VIGILSWIVRFLMVLFVVRLAGRLAVQFLRGAERRRGADDTELVRDTICNTFLPRSRALHAKICGEERHFCSPACAQRALAESGRA
jgi:hypothetical protein